MPTTDQEIEQLANREYKWGFTSDIEADEIPAGLSEDVVRLISQKKEEPAWLLEWRLRAYAAWRKMEEPHHWGKLKYPAIDYNAISYYSAPKKAKYKSLDEVDPELLAVYDKLGIPLSERKTLLGVEDAATETKGDVVEEMTKRGVAVDAVFDSVSVKTTFQKELKKAGVIFMSFGEAAREHPELVQKYLGSVVPYRDNYYATLNSAVFTDGSFVYIPPGVDCPMELSTYFRINAQNTGQFERTLIIADEGGEGVVSGGLHRADARRKPAPRGRRGTGGNEGGGHQVQHRAELVSRRRGGQGGHLQLRHQARPGGGERQDQLDAGRNRLRHYLEVPECDLAGRQQPGRVLQRRGEQQAADRRHRHEDDPHW